MSGNNATLVSVEPDKRIDCTGGLGGDCAYIAEPLRRLAVPVASLCLDPSNVRTHNERNLGAICASLARFGQRSPIVVQKQGMVVRAGNGRLLAAKSLGWKHIAAIVVDESSVEATAFAIADNRTAELAEWDQEGLAALLQSMDKDMQEVAGFSQSDLDQLLRELGPAEIVEDEVPEPPPVLITKPGDLWLLGEHRLLCGDSTKAEDVSRALKGEKAALCLTDPPYGIGESYNQHDDTESNLDALISGFLPHARFWCRNVLLTPGNKNQWRYPKPDWTLCWFVPAGIGRGPWGFTCWQPILAYGKDPYLQAGEGSRPDGLTLTQAAENHLGHPCPKPLKVWSWFMQRGSIKLHEVVFDPFCGSGTTIIAAEQLQRRCYAIEISPQYCDVAVARWEKFTGKKAVRDGA